MVTSLKVVGIGGSLAGTSTSRAALACALEGAAEGGAETRLYDLKELDLPMYSPEITTIPDKVHEYAETVFEAHGLIWSSPLYNGTISGSFKNALDWLHLLINRDPPFLTDKIVGLICTAGGTQGLQAINTMEFCVRALRGWAVPLVLPIAQAGKSFDADGRPHDDALADQIRGVGREVARVSRQANLEGYNEYSLPYGKLPK